MSTHDMQLILAGGFFSTIMVLLLAFYILLIIAQWKIFTKAGEKGWKSLIPIYNLYIQFKITWETKYLWIGLLIMILGSFMYGIFGTGNVVLYAISQIIMLAGIVVLLVDEYWLSKSFGHSFGYFIGLLFLPNIFTLIIGFGQSKYIGCAGAGKSWYQN